MLQLGDERQGWLNALIRLSSRRIEAATKEPITRKNARTVRHYSRYGLK
jgi:hypothetical protein